MLVLERSHHLRNFLEINGSTALFQDWNKFWVNKQAIILK
jgi:hypothetical protein